MIFTNIKSPSYDISVYNFFMSSYTIIPDLLCLKKLQYPRGLNSVLQVLKVLVGLHQTAVQIRKLMGHDHSKEWSLCTFLFFFVISFPNFG